MIAVQADDSGRDVLLQLGDAPRGVAEVHGADGAVLGTVSDVGLRRAALAGRSLDVPVTELLDTEPPAAADGGPPVSAVVLAGGRGQRLAPLTDKVPKPLLTVGRTTILERILEGLAASGVTDVWLSVNYKAEVFEERLGDGSSAGVRLRYLRELKPLHTAGPLSLLPEPPAGPLLVMNADQVTALHYARMVEYHRAAGASITVGAFAYEVQVPYGVLELDDGAVTGIVEKPVLRNHCNAGIYVIEPDVVPLVPRNTFFGMPSLVERALAEGRPVAAFPILETFIDIGTREELDKALLWFATGEEV